MQFFTLFDDKPIVRGDEQVKVKAPTIRKEYSCADCGMDAYCEAPMMPYRGNGEKKVLIVGEMPSAEEDELGFYGKSASVNFLKDTLKSLGYNLFNDAWYTTAVRCYGKKKAPHAINACRRQLLATIDELKPKSIVLLGSTAFDSLIRPMLVGRINGAEASAFYGKCIPDQKLKTHILPTFAPTYLKERRIYEDGDASDPLYERDPNYLKAFTQSLQSAFTIEGFYETNYASDCLITEDETQALQWLEEALTWEKLSFDYETTGLRPQRKGHEIICVSISNGMFSYAFPMFQSKKFTEAYKKLMLKDNKKISHNLSFEAVWTREILGYWPVGWFWDTMLGHHCLYNQEPTNLKFCTYCSLGIIGYDDGVDKYIKSLPQEETVYGCNSFNTLKDAPLKDVLFYCAQDSLYTYKLQEIQESQMIPHVRSGFDFFVTSATNLAKVSHNGIRIDPDAFVRAGEMLEQQKASVLKEFMACPEIAKWDGDSPINIMSTSQLSHLTFDILGVAPLKRTESGAPSLDKDTIGKFGLHYLNLVVKYREFDKMKSTVIDGWKREAVDGYVHASFNLGTVATMRSSTTQPNTQNNYKRDPVKKKISRAVVIPRRGNRLVEYDYKGLEVVINACHSQDSNLIRYITDTSNDMHLESTMDCFIMDKIEAKPHRGAVKGLFVFSEFYGNWYGQVAHDLWEYAEEEGILPHLKSKGIKNYEKFEKHIQEAERILWEERFPEHRAWMKQQYKLYLKNGYLDTYTGFRPRFPMSRNVSYNIKVQGDGFHVLLWGLNQLQKRMETLERSFIINEIHDSIVVDVHPSEEHLVDYWVHLYLTKKVREQWPWINLPLQVEKSKTEVGASWDTMEDCGYLTGE